MSFISADNLEDRWDFHKLTSFEVFKRFPDIEIHSDRTKREISLDGYSNLLVGVFYLLFQLEALVLV